MIRLIMLHPAVAPSKEHRPAIGLQLMRRVATQALLCTSTALLTRFGLASLPKASIVKPPALLTTHPLRSMATFRNASVTIVDPVPR
jgi:hypothetical protein